MDETYPTVRALLNDKNRNLKAIVSDWPYMVIKMYFLEHSSRLLGKNTHQEYTNALNKRVNPTRKYLKSLKLKGKETKMKDIIKESVEASAVTRDVKPKLLVVFPLLAAYFNENICFLFKIVNVS